MTRPTSPGLPGRGTRQPGRDTPHPGRGTPQWGRGVPQPGRGSRAPSRGSYFFLSYAHSAPTPGMRTDTDVWVGQFFEDLAAEVRRLARPVPGMRIGFFDRHIPLGADWKAALAEALGTAEVFVPLYSPGYFSRPWALGEQESFRARLADARPVNPATHLLPVLWIPFPTWERRPELAAALRLGRDVPDYPENGLRALCMLATYRNRYLMVLRRLAQRIVRAAEEHPLGPSHAPSLATPPTDPAFVVAVLAPTRDTLPPGRAATGYAELARDWRPYGDRQELPVAEYVASTAERLGLPARTTDFDTAAELLAGRPAVVLIDPWLAALPQGLSQLVDAARTLPEWAVPLVVTDARDPQDPARATHLAEQVLDRLHAAGVSRARWAPQVPDFVELMPELVTEARRQYLKYGPVYPPPGPHEPPPSLSDPSPATPAPQGDTDEQ